MAPTLGSMERRALDTELDGLTVLLSGHLCQETDRQRTPYGAQGSSSDQSLLLESVYLS